MSHRPSRNPTGPAAAEPALGGDRSELPDWIRNRDLTAERTSGAAPLSPVITSHVLTMREVADVLRVSSRTVRRMIDRGELQAVRIGRSVRVQRAAVEALLGGCKYQ